MNRRKLLKSKECGSALGLVLLAVVILLLTGGGMLKLGLHGRMQAVKAATEISARSAADAGLAKAVFEMDEKLRVQPWNDSNLPQAINETLPGCNATYSYAVTGDANSGYTIESTGSSGQAERKVNAALRRKGLFEYGLLTKETIQLEMNTLVYGYDSDTNSTDAELTIGTISTAPDSIILGGGSTIDGDVFVGFQGDTETVIQNNGTVINGQTYALSGDLPFPVITPPSLPDTGTMDIAAGSTTVVGPADNGKYTSITLQGSGILKIDGGDVVLHVTGNVVMNGGSQIQIEAGSSLILYVDGNMIGDGSNNVEINNYTGVPGGLKLCLIGASEQTLEFVNNSDIFMAIYAPNTNVIFKNNTNFRGSIVAKSVYMKNNSLFYYDVALQGEGIGSNNTGVRFVVQYWQEG